MSKARKFLEGELRFVEDQTSVDEFLKTIATELVKRDWVDYKKNRWDTPWSFDENREIKLPESFRKENIKLFKSLATTEILPAGVSMGKIRILTGVTTPEFNVINLTLNDLSYVINLDVGDTKEEVATKVVDFVKEVEGFAGSYVANDGVTAIITGEHPVFNLESDADTQNQIAGELITFSSVGDGVKTGTITVLSEALETGEVKITLNGTVLTLPITEGHSALQVARSIRDRIIAMGEDFANTTNLENIVTIAGKVDVTSLILDSNDTKLTNTQSSVQGGFGIIKVLSEARQSGSVTLTLNGAERVVAIIKGDTPVDIAQKIQTLVASLTGFTLTNSSDTTVTIAGSTTVVSLTVNTDVDVPPALFTDSRVNNAFKVGTIQIVTPATVNQTLEVSINGSSYNISVAGGDSTNIIARKVKDVVTRDSPFTLTSYIGDTVTIIGATDVFAVGTPNDLDSDKPYVTVEITTGDLNMGRITIIQKVSEDTSITVTVNNGNHLILVLASDSTEGIATKIGDILSAIDGYSETTVEGSTVSVEGSVSVDYLNVSATEISSSDFEMFDDVVKGVGDNTSGTMVGDNVLIKVLHGGEEFQRVAFLSEGTPSGDTKNIARLKSRPKGDIVIHEDTILEITGEILQQRGEGIFYKVGRSPISKSRGNHKLVVKRGATIVPATEYEVDYFNGALIFKIANDSDDVITVDYGVCMGLSSEEIPSDKYRIINDMLIDVTETGELKDLDVIVTANYYWELAYPTSLIAITGATDRIILKTRIDVTSSKNKSHKKNYFWELRHSKADENKYLTGLECRFGTALDGSKTTLDNNTSSAWARWAWYDQDGFAKDGLVMKGWLPIHYQMNFTQEYLNIVVQGSPSVDGKLRDNYLISHAYIGALESYEGAKNEDTQYNFGMAVGGDELHEKGKFPKDWGQRTGTCVTDITMERTGDGVPFQAHYPSFYTNPEFLDKHFIGESGQTGSYHFGEVVVTHDVQRERGKLQGLLIGDRSAIHHLDTLVSNEDTFNASGILLNQKGGHYSPCNGANTSKEKKWVMFNINSPFWFANNSPNIFYGVALRKS